MFALLIKPAAMQKKANRNFIANLKSAGAIQLTGHTIEEIAEEIAQLLKLNEHLVIVACGGDGTVHLALNVAMIKNIPLAVVPMGTGNDFARHYGIKNLHVAKQVLAEKPTIKIDVGEISKANGENRFYGAVASCGFDALVNERANQIAGPNGPIKYLWSVFLELRDLKPLKLRIELDHRKEEGEYSLVAIANTASYGGGMKIAPAASPTDGKFSCVIVGKVNRRTLVRVLPRVFTGGHVFHPAVSVDESAVIAISGDSYQIYADGERIGLGPASFSTRPESLQLLAP